MLRNHARRKLQGHQWCPFFFASLSPHQYFGLPENEADPNGRSGISCQVIPKTLAVNGLLSQKPPEHRRQQQVPLPFPLVEEA